MYSASVTHSCTCSRRRHQLRREVSRLSDRYAADSEGCPQRAGEDMRAPHHDGRGRDGGRARPEATAGRLRRRRPTAMTPRRRRRRQRRPRRSIRLFSMKHELSTHTSYCLLLYITPSSSCRWHYLSFASFGKIRLCATIFAVLPQQIVAHIFRPKIVAPAPLFGVLRTAADWGTSYSRLWRQRHNFFSPGMCATTLGTIGSGGIGAAPKSVQTYK